MRIIGKFIIGIFAVIAGVILYVLLAPVISDGPDSRSREKDDVTRLSIGLSFYKGEYGVYPEGGQATILKILQGDNKRKIVFYEISPKQLNEKGELMDSWGTPYRIEIDQKTYRPHVSSAGKNKVFEPEKKKSDDIRSWE